MLNLEIRTIENLIFDSEIESVSFFSGNGYVSIYPGHEDMVLQIKAGEIEIKTQDGASIFYVLDGIAKILNGEKITMLVNELETSEDLTEEMVQNAVKKAQESLDQAESSSEYSEFEYEMLKAQLIKELAKESSFRS